MVLLTTSEVFSRKPRPLLRRVKVSFLEPKTMLLMAKKLLRMAKKQVGIS